MGFARKQTTKEVYASPRPFDGSNDSSIESVVPSDVPARTLEDQHIFEQALKLLADVKAAGECMFRQLLMLLRDYKEHGLHPGLITRFEELFEGHRDLLVAFNTFLPERCQCTVPE